MTLATKFVYSPFMKKLCYSNLQSLRFVSSVSQSETVLFNKNDIYTENTNVCDHSEADIGKFYQLNAEDYNTLIPKINKFVHPSWREMMETFGKTHFMIRKPAIDILSCLKNFPFSNNFPSPRCLIYGDYGNGKSMTLYHLLHYFHQKNWIIFHIPFCSRLVSRVKKVQVENSPMDEKLLDLPTRALELLDLFKHQNGGKLNNLKIGKEYLWNKREMSKVGSSIMELVDFGITRPKYACAVYGTVLQELKRCANEGLCNFVFAVDQVNALWKKTSLIKEKINKSIVYMDSNQISLVQYTKKFLSDRSWSNGLVIGIADGRVIQLFHEKDTNVEFIRNADKLPVLPFQCLGQEGFEALDPFLPFHVDRYTTEEAENYIQYLIDSNWIQHKEGKTQEAVDYLIALSDKNPLELNNVIAPL